MEAVRDDLGLLSDWLGAAVDLLEDDLHHGGLELREHAHLRERLLSLPLLLFLGEFTGGTAVEEGRYFDALSNALRVLALLLLNALLDVLRIIPLKNVSLALEAFIELRQVLNEILDRLRALLLLGERHLQDLTSHSAFGASILRGIGNEIHLLCQHYIVNRSERTIERHLHRVLERLIIRRLTDELIGSCSARHG